MRVSYGVSFVVVVVRFISNKIQQWNKNKDASNYIKVLMHSACGHQWSGKAHQAGNQKHVSSWWADMGVL